MADGWRFDSLSCFIGATGVWIVVAVPSVLDAIDHLRDATDEEDLASQVIRQEPNKYCLDNGRPIGTSQNDFRFYTDIWCVENNRLVKYDYERKDSEDLHIRERTERARFVPLDSVPDGVSCPTGSTTIGAEVEGFRVMLWCRSGTILYSLDFWSGIHDGDPYVEKNRYEWTMDFQAL